MITKEYATTVKNITVDDFVNDNEDEHQRLRKRFPGLENKRGLFQPLAVGQNYEWGGVVLVVVVLWIQ